MVLKGAEFFNTMQRSLMEKHSVHWWRSAVFIGGEVQCSLVEKCSVHWWRSTVFIGGEAQCSLAEEHRARGDRTLAPFSTIKHCWHPLPVGGMTSWPHSNLISAPLQRTQLLNPSEESINQSLICVRMHSITHTHTKDPDTHILDK